MVCFLCKRALIWNLFQQNFLFYETLLLHQDSSSTMAPKENHGCNCATEIKNGLWSILIVFLAFQAVSIAYDIGFSHMNVCLSSPVSEPLPNIRWICRPYCENCITDQNEYRVGDETCHAELDNGSWFVDDRIIRQYINHGYWTRNTIIASGTDNTIR